MTSGTGREVLGGNVRDFRRGSEVGDGCGVQSPLQLSDEVDQILIVEIQRLELVGLLLYQSSLSFACYANWRRLLWPESFVR